MCSPHPFTLRAISSLPAHPPTRPPAASLHDAAGEPLSSQPLRWMARDTLPRKTKSPSALLAQCNMIYIRMHFYPCVFIHVIRSIYAVLATIYRKLCALDVYTHILFADIRECVCHAHIHACIHVCVCTSIYILICAETDALHLHRILYA